MDRVGGVNDGGVSYSCGKLLFLVLLHSTGKRDLGVPVWISAAR